MSRRRVTPLVPLRRARWVLALAVAGSVVLLAIGVPAASAHDELVGASPADGTSLATSPPSVQLDFSRPLPPLGAEVVVSGPDGAAVAQGAAEVDRTSVNQPLVPDLPAGTYSVAWRVTSSDGHPISGTTTFTVTGGATGGATGTPAPVSEAAAAQPAGSSSSGRWIAIGAAAVLLVAGGFAARQLRRRA